MPDSREAIIFVHGYDVKEKGYYLDFLIEALTKCARKKSVSVEGEANIQNVSGKRLNVNHNNESKSVDVFEAYWADYIKPLSKEDIKTKVVRGFQLIVYWISSKHWKSVRQSKYMKTSIFLSQFSLLFWYLSTLALAVSVIGSNDILEKYLLGPYTKHVGTVETWALIAWIIMASIMKFLPIRAGIDVTEFVRSYLQKDLVDNKLRLNIYLQNRVWEICQKILNDDKYSKVTIVAHSFGVAICTNLLADYKNLSTISVRYITLGGALPLLAWKSDEMKKSVEKCLDNDSFEWIDYYSRQDWMCSKLADSNIVKGYKNCPIDFKCSILKMFNGNTHLYYFSNTEIMENILN
jgi:hypothetical protein